MKCHENNKNKKHNPIKHILMMVLCCGLPYLIIGVLPFINASGVLKNIIVGITPFICPLMMVIMIPMMVRAMKGGSCCSKKEEIQKEEIKL
ncbi:hypothetical protein [Clostridium cibarium]|uniref:DUF2933 domain-containing protein n=1 Tax=Clostridium cibarium TaxID=2762247 RepID=A0ABR8PVT2_9CLOT|nr:hypothetical protein [Clostridium cibarium]MBD7912287.1 hypothetical protein [Clostridium cibarium]